MTRYYHLEPDSLFECSTQLGFRHYVVGDISSQYEDDDSENIEFSISGVRDARQIASFLLEFIEKYSSENDEYE